MSDYIVHRQHVCWADNEGAKMTNDDKREEAEMTSNRSREITTDELNQVAGGMGPVFLSLMPYPKKGALDTIGEAIGPVLSKT
jgi:hypothetical protein